MIPFHEAKSIINEHLFTLESELIPFHEAGGRVLAQDIIASFSSPQFDNSAMDGFAIKSADTKGARQKKSVTLTLVGISSAGTPSDITLNSGECIQCMTGAKIPNGADAVIMVEDTSGFSNDDSVRFTIEATPGKHIRKKGEEINEGEILIQKGTPITPSEIGTCATFGYANLSVFKKPKIAIFGAGDELVEPGEPLGEGQIYNSNLYVFSELVNRAGADIILQNVIKDDKESLRLFLSEALDTCDIIISSGGVSMGRYDYVREVFMELGVEEHFWKVAQKPGKPLFFGTGNSTLIFGLPGNPVSAYIGFMEWVWPVLESMMGKKESEKVKGILKKPFPREKMKYRFLFGNAWIEDGQLVCQPSTKTGSHMLSSSLIANCILSSEPGESSLQVDEKINVNILPWKSIK
ncbi:MAG: molybdopterin molybdotransferase MoeA [Candidatus Marinimicrobia bacterium]|jgi:molybdopterin molybdotransferase|nr:molybdopterin molybdotransferase MoeA [Candidatus Neomarinimicrobiota bacterium]MBT3617280.1 molybdopterin molybdotransferase MoeA [Candidatus Neomarinimicrobiota bacterium]MBT3828843.1 molybdopterin molybdotransferase MoeA [Candidatus Neomarinimicrobiota bacterium]MBT3997814.1 molybdopterin molybdotransferase MoeA [Candidatus Neomarinimicrobiota bacterium]MBT4280528.1 molybdopterin molybdotransferase MoeA [Candidatus Neomarinimicrobiota bacterium]